MEKLIFDRNRKRIKYCPCCGHDNKKGGYVPYIGTNAGYCNYCGSSCFPNKNGTPKYETWIAPTYQPIKEKPTSFIDVKWHESSLNKWDKNDFVKFLKKEFSKDQYYDIIKKYRLGTKDSDVIFWQIDIDKRIRSGKIMAYNPETGKRQKRITWVHSKIENFNLNQCLFGEHLLIGNNKPIAIVESEKTACIMSQCRPDFLWLATGGSTSGIDKKFKTLIGNQNEVILFPDEGKYQEWLHLQETILKYNSGVSKDCDIWYEKEDIKKGDDIADYYLNKYGSTGLNLLKPKVKYYDPEWNQKEYNNIFKNK